MRRVLGVLSGKGGVGKTTLSANLGLAIHNLGEDVAVVDADLKNPTLGIQLGVFDYDVTLHDVVEKEMPLLEAMYVHRTGLKFVPSHVSLDYLDIDPAKLRRVFEEVYFTTIIDSPPGLGKEALSVLEVCDEVLVVTTPALPDVAGALRIIEVAKGMGVGVKGIIINKRRGRDYEVSREEIEAVSGTRVLQTIPWDENVIRSVSEKEPLIEFNPYSKAAQSIYSLASDITGIGYETPQFSGVKRLIRTLSNLI